MAALEFFDDDTPGRRSGSEEVLPESRWAHRLDVVLRSRRWRHLGAGAAALIVIATLGASPANTHDLATVTHPGVPRTVPVLDPAGAANRLEWLCVGQVRVVAPKSGPGPARPARVVFLPANGCVAGFVPLDAAPSRVDRDYLR